jgi:hypothetical protein
MIQHRTDGRDYAEFGMRLEDAAYITPQGSEILHESNPFDRPAVRLILLHASLPICLENTADLLLE